MQPRNLKALTYSGYVFSLAAYIFMGAVAAHPYDDAVIVQHAQLFYHLGTNPLFYLPQGIYWDIISIGSYFPEVVMHILGFQNVITIHLATKLFIIISAFLSAIYIRKIVEFITGDERKGLISFFLFILNPIIFYTATIYGSSIIIAVLFITMSTFFIIKGNNILGAIFYGLSMGTFLYPLLGIPTVMRYVAVRSNTKKSLTFLLIALLFGAIGQGPIFIFYLFHGSGLGGLPVGAGYLATTQVFPPFSIFDIFNIYPVLKFPYLNYLFYAAELFGSFIFFVIPKEKVDPLKLFAFLGIQGVIFSSLASGGVLMSFPSAFVPFAILYAFTSRRYSILVPLTVSFVTLSFAMETINNIGLPIYFLDINHKVLLHTTSFSSNYMQLAGFLFGISVLSMIPIFLLRGRKEGKRLRAPMAATGASAAIVVALLILAVAVIAPAIGSVPSTYYLQNPIGSSGVTESESISNGIMHLNYTVYLLAFTPDQYYNKITLWLQEPGGYFSYGSYNFTELIPINGSVSFPYLVGFPSIGSKISIIASSQNITMTLSNLTSRKLITPTVADYGSHYLLSYPIGALSGGNYKITLRGNGNIGVYNSPGKELTEDGKTINGIAVDTVFYFYPYLSSGTVNGVSLQEGQAVTVPISAYAYKLDFSFPGYYLPISPPFPVLDIRYGGYSTISLVEGALAFIGVAAAFVVFYRIRNR